MTLMYTEKINHNTNVQQAAVSGGGINQFLSADNFDKLTKTMYSAKVKAGSTLFWEGDEAGKLYYIRSGRVKLRKSTEDGKDFILSIMSEGDLLGEYGGCEELFHSYTAEVTEDSDIGIIQLKDLEVLLYQFGDFAIEFTNWLGLANRTIQSKFRDLLLFGKPGALASTLIRLSNTYGILRTDGIHLDIRLTNTEIADFIGTARESVNRMLHSLKDEGIISMEKGQIVIKRLDALRLICNCPKYPVCPKEICRI